MKNSDGFFYLKAVRRRVGRWLRKGKAGEFSGSCLDEYFQISLKVELQESPESTYAILNHPCQLHGEALLDF